MPETATTLRQLHDEQYAFAAHLRYPNKNPAPTDIDKRRMDVYSELFFNNVVKFLGGNFPITRKILGNTGWQSLMRDYYRDHVSHSPLFPDMPREFLAYLIDERQARPDDPPFLYEFAHYEWVEAGLMLAADPPEQHFDPSGNLMTERPILIEPAWLLSYRFAVNEISESYQPQAPAEEPLHYLVYRNADFKIVFLKLNNVSARLFELLQSDPKLTGKIALEKIVSELNHPQPETVIAGGQQMLKQWRVKNVILGTATTG